LEGHEANALAAKAEAKGVDLSDLVCDLLRREIEIVEAVG